jgi:hypothetical protein
VVRALCLGLQPECPAPRGVQIKGATILGQLDLQDHLIAARLILDECVLADGINACFATILLMDLSGSRLGSLLAARAHVKHNLILGGVAVLHRVDLRQAVIEGQLYADELRITGAPGTVALRGDGIRVDGDIFLRRSEIHGEARFPAAQVGGVSLWGRASFSAHTGPISRKSPSIAMEKFACWVAGSVMKCAAKAAFSAILMALLSPVIACGLEAAFFSSTGFIRQVRSDLLARESAAT